MKKAMALVLCLVMVLGATSALAATKVSLITMDLMDQHWVNVDRGCQDAVAELKEKGVEIEYNWDAPTDGKNDAAQIECINNAYANSVEIILLASNGPDTQVATIEQYTNDGVKFIYVDSPANFEAIQTLATNNTNAGQTAGEQMLKAFEAAGITEGKLGIVNVNPATQSTVDREAGFRKAFEGTKFEILETQYGEGKVDLSQEIAAGYITNGCVGIFGTNEGGTVGVGNAIKEAGGDIVGVGFDQSDAIKELTKEGILLCAMAQDPYKMGYEGIMTAAKVLAGEEVTEKNIDTGVQVVDAAALAQ